MSRNKSLPVILLFCCLIIPAAFASGPAAPSVAWEKTYSIGLQNKAFDVIQAQDGGFVIAGSALISNDTSLSNPFGEDADAFLIRTDGEGRELWIKTYGSNRTTDGFRAVQETLDGGFILAGYTSGRGADRYLVRTDSDGNITWEKHFESNSGFDVLNGVCALPNGNFIVAGETDQEQRNGKRDSYLAEVDRDGGIVRERIYPGGYWEGYLNGGLSLDCAGNEGYLFTGSPALIRADADGNIIWPAYTDRVLFDARFSPDGGAISTSIDESPETGHPVLLLQKIDSTGRPEWRTPAPHDWSWGRAVEVTSDDGFLAIGTTAILDEVTPEVNYNTTYNLAILLLKTDSHGNILWTTTLGPAPFNEGMRVRETSDSGYIVLGTIADEAGLEYLLFMGNIPGKIYLAKLSEGNGTNDMVTGPAGSVTPATSIAPVTSGAPVISGTEVETDGNSVIPEIPLVYAPVITILILLVLIEYRKI